MGILSMKTSVRFCVAGGGSWGTALAHLLAGLGYDVCLWLRDEAAAASINDMHENTRYLPGLPLHPALRADTDPRALGASILVLAIPCQQLRAWLAAHQRHFCASPILINAAKGLEVGSLATPSRIVAESLSGTPFRFAALSGPSFAAEVLRGLPTAVVLAGRDAELVRHLRELLSGPRFRCYSSADVVGVEMGGALKNVMAIAAGVCDGLHFGHNTRAALMTRGLAEMSRIGMACGAKERTFMGLSGLGDLTLTCTGDLSRNRQVGLRLGRGEALDDITASLGMVAEGVKTTLAVHDLAQRLGVDAPITSAMHSILFSGEQPADAVTRLMTRTLREE